MTDHLDSSPSEAVRRHAETFRSVRTRLAAERAADKKGEGSGGGAPGEDGTARVSDGDGLRVLGAGSAAKVAEVAASSGWRVTVRVGQARRERGGAWFDSAVVACMWVEASATPIAEARVVTHWALGHWRADPVVIPLRRKWKFFGATAWNRDGGVRTIGARELTGLVGS